MLTTFITRHVKRYMEKNEETTMEEKVKQKINEWKRETYDESEGDNNEGDWQQSITGSKNYNGAARRSEEERRKKNEVQQQCIRRGRGEGDLF